MIRGFVIFYNPEGQPLDTFPISYEDTIPGHTAKRITGSVDSSVQRLSESSWVSSMSRVNWR